MGVAQNYPVMNLTTRGHSFRSSVAETEERELRSSEDGSAGKALSDNSSP